MDELGIEPKTFRISTRCKANALPLRHTPFRGRIERSALNISLSPDQGNPVGSVHLHRAL